MTADERALRTAAYRLVRGAIRRGEMVRPSECEDCGRTVPIHAHHHRGYDLAHALDVLWLCWDCHAWRHATGQPRVRAMPPEVRAAVRTLADWMRPPEGATA